MTLAVATQADVTFPALGTEVRVAADGPAGPALVARARAEIHALERVLSRFDPASELCALNADPREVVPVSAQLAAALRAALAAARASRGAVVPTLLGSLEAAGYDRSFDAGLDGRGAQHELAASRCCAWREIEVGARAVRRPPGLRLDLGGTAKGHIADTVSRHLAPLARWLVDAGGDLRAGGPWTVYVDGTDVALQVHDGAVATSSTRRRAWRDAAGRPAHHLLDPAGGRPARTHGAQATALAPTALEAETRAKVALLRGPDVLRRHGGVLVHHDGAVERIGLP